jgi:ABC-type bacteriocin/lantibiotic exporter with double-glycine peptidase domain
LGSSPPCALASTILTSRDDDAGDLVIENLTKRWGDRLAVDIPSLTIRGGEFFTLVGPSG